MSVLSLNLVVLRSQSVALARRFYEAFGLRFREFRYEHDAVCVQTDIPRVPLILDYNKESGVPPTSTTLEIHPLGEREPTIGVILGFFVDSVDNAVQAALAAGGILVLPAANWPYGRRAAMSDPDGHRVELSEHPGGRPTGSYPG